MAKTFFNLLHTFSIGLRSPLPGGNLTAVRPCLWSSASTFHNVSLIKPHPQPLEASTLVHNKFLTQKKILSGSWHSIAIAWVAEVKFCLCSLPKIPKKRNKKSQTFCTKPRKCEKLDQKLP